MGFDTKPEDVGSVTVSFPGFEFCPRKYTQPVEKFPLTSATKFETKVVPDILPKVATTDELVPADNTIPMASASSLLLHVANVNPPVDVTLTTEPTVNPDIVV
jgi:hypothetical protein